MFRQLMFALLLFIGCTTEYVRAEIANSGPLVYHNWPPTNNRAHIASHHHHNQHQQQPQQQSLHRLQRPSPAVVMHQMPPQSVYHHPMIRTPTLGFPNHIVSRYPQSSTLSSSSSSLSSALLQSQPSNIVYSQQKLRPQSISILTNIHHNHNQLQQQPSSHSQTNRLMLRPKTPLPSSHQQLQQHYLLTSTPKPAAYSPYSVVSMPAAASAAISAAQYKQSQRMSGHPYYPQQPLPKLQQPATTTATATTTTASRLYVKPVNVAITRNAIPSSMASKKKQSSVDYVYENPILGMAQHGQLQMVPTSAIQHVRS